MDYSYLWFKKASVQELEVEREKVRQAYCSSSGDMTGRLQNLLFLFDKEISKKTLSSADEYIYPPKREHGWYLQNDD